MHHAPRLPTVRETGGEAIDQPDRTIRRTQQQCARVRGHRAAAEIGHNVTPLQAGKTHRLRVTLREHRGTPLQLTKSLMQKNFLMFRVPMHLLLVRNPG